jgi:hypothetical protein
VLARKKVLSVKRKLGKFSRTGKLNINIFPQNCWRGGGGGGWRSPKLFFRTYKKKFSSDITKYSVTSRNFHKIQTFFHSISKFSKFFYVLPEFRIDFCPTVKIWGGMCQFSSRPSWESPLATSIGKSPSNGQYIG